MNKRISVKVNDPDTQITVERPTPQHDRLREVKTLSQKLHEFLLEFLGEKGIELATRDEDGEMFMCMSRPEKLIAEFLEIDLDELENEKRRMLQDIRVENARRDAEKELPTTKKAK